MNTTLKREDFVHQNEVKWCPGCGDYAVLSALQRLLPTLGRPPEEHVFVSGIGCAGRLPYYMNTYGFHTIHGRATAVATGLKAIRDDLSVWVITGDGDALSIGTNHLIHLLRRNVSVNVLMLNNQVYGLTKGQFSPTSPSGQVTKTSPEGVNQDPINPVMLALGAGASFVARAVDKDPNHLMEVLKAAYFHPGTSFVEILQDCNIFNHGAFDAFSTKTNRATQTIRLQHGQALVYGAEDTQCLIQSGDSLMAKEGSIEHAVVHDETNLFAAIRLSQLKMPVPLGVFYRQEKPIFQLKNPNKKNDHQDFSIRLSNLYRAKASWQEK